MASLISALDNHTPSQIGENGSNEYTWSHSIKERINQLSFQLTRTRDSNTIDKLALQTDGILKGLSGAYNAGTLGREEYIEYMSIMYRMIAQTRDIIDGKGEYALSYMLIGVWEKHFPELAKFALRYFVLNLDGVSDEHPYGCWKDIKYLYKQYQLSPLVLYGMDLLLNQIREDVSSDKPSLAAKWVPREKSSFGSLFCELANRYFPEYLASAKNNEQRKRATLKAKTEFRKIISALNKKLDTVQIKQCGNDWASIDPTKQTSITMHKQKRAFLNKDKEGNQRSDLEDRIACGLHFEEFAQKAKRGEVEVKGKRVGLNTFTEEAFKLIGCKEDSSEASILNAQWVDNSKQTGALGKVIAMVDVSGSMHGDPMHAAIALGIRVAEKSVLGKRVLTFSGTPSWVNLDGYDTFVSMVSVLSRADWGMNTNFHAAMKLILDAIIANKLQPVEVKGMVLAIFSDMQMDASGCGPNPKSLMESIKDMYSEAGIRLHGEPFEPPHILFWNLRSTDGFPALSTMYNCSMMSGFSPALLNLFCEKGLEALESCSPWSLLVESLNKDRYSILDKFIRETL
jgi:hypothetical protein